MTKVLIGCPARQKPHIFREYLQSLRALRLPAGVEVTRRFFLHGCPELAEMLLPEEECRFKEAEDTYETDGTSHKWRLSNFAAVVEMKNSLLQQARDGGFDCFFLVDSDLILHPDTLRRLLSLQKDIVSEIFWTKWEKDQDLVGPNCWDMDMCTYGRFGFQRFRVPDVHLTGGTGACILLSRKVLETETVNYDPLYNVSFSRWEDRAFCIRAVVNGFPIWIDTTLPATHLYRQEDYEKYMESKA